MASAAPHESDEIKTIITVLHPEILRTHILSRLDGATLAAASSVSSKLRRLCTDEDLWRNVCTATWPSLVDPIASHVISSFPGGHRSFFSDAFSSVHYDNPVFPPRAIPHLPELISAVDIYCQGKPLFSTVQRIEIQGNMFDLLLNLPLQLDVLQPNVSVPDPVNNPWIYNGWICKYLQENLRLSWIVIDPIGKRAANLSSWEPVWMQWNMRMSEVEVVFAVVMAGGPYGPNEKVRCMMKVTCCRELHVTKVKMLIDDLDGSPVTRKEGVFFLMRAIENGERKKVDTVREKKRFEKLSLVIDERNKIMSDEARSRWKTYEKTGKIDLFSKAKNKLKISSAKDLNLLGKYCDNLKRTS